MAATGAVGTHAEAGAWPKNPWTGEAMKGGSALGDFVYTRNADGHRFTIALRTSSGTARSPATRAASPWKTRRDGYRDQITKLGTALIRDAVEQWAFDSNDMYPDEADVAADGGVGMFFVDLDWPTNPVTNTLMEDEAGNGFVQLRASGTAAAGRSVSRRCSRAGRSRSGRASRSTRSRSSVCTSRTSSRRATSR